jgi:hypothetical protein
MDFITIKNIIIDIKNINYITKEKNACFILAIHTKDDKILIVVYESEEKMDFDFQIISSRLELHN